MKAGKKWMRLLMPVMALTFLSFAQGSFAQDDYQDNSNNSYDNSDEALVQPDNDVDYNTFHDELSPYGTWRDYPGYGNVWVCNVADFRPYSSGGHWAYTRFGWTWVSDYNWGWAPFHYGRWAFDNAYGWFWVPGYTWGPAWVSWRTGGDYYGWAPLSPGLSIGVNVGVGIAAASWVFLPHRYMGYRSINSYYIPRQQNVTIIRNTTIINNTNVYNNNRFVVGPDRRQVERYSGQRVQQQQIYVSNNRNVNRNDRNGIQMFHPNVNRERVVNRNNNNNRENNQPNNRAQDNVRQQQPNRQPIQNGVQQQNSNQADNNRIDRFQQRREQMQQNDQQRQQQIQDNRKRAQQQNNDQQHQQVDQQRQQQMNQQKQQQDNQRQQQMQQRQQQMNQQRQQQDNQRQQQMQQRQQQMQQRQQQMQQQRNQNNNRPASQGGGGRKQNR